MSGASQGIMILLMLIGGSPGSTAGGIKTTTFVVLLVYVSANLRNKTYCNVFGRRLDDGAIRKGQHGPVHESVPGIHGSDDSGRQSSRSQ